MVWATKSNLVKAIVLAYFVAMAGIVSAETNRPVQPSKKDKCPVCGMFVYKYPDWLAEVIFRDGSADFFDGAKDLFKYYFALKKYRPEKNRDDIVSLYVMEYYDMKMIEARSAFFVTGSDVYGPMGHELIPFTTEEDAKTFMRDHKGKQIMRFRDITPMVIDKLD